MSAHRQRDRLLVLPYRLVQLALEPVTYPESLLLADGGVVEAEEGGLASAGGNGELRERWWEEGLEGDCEGDRVSEQARVGIERPGTPVTSSQRSFASSSTFSFVASSTP